MNGGLIQRSHQWEAGRTAFTSALCGIPVDAQQFDESSIAPLPDTGREVLLARFELQPQYCGVFENFAQFVGDAFGRGLPLIDTPGLQWLIQMNGRPLYPYVNLKHVVNPWGFGSFPVAIRLDENASVEFVVRNVSYVKPARHAIHSVGGRIAGRYWYNPAYGDVTARGSRLG